MPDLISGGSGPSCLARGADVLSIIIIGGNLFEIAATQLGSALQWINIARANDMIDPMLSGQNEITVPPSSPVFADGIGPQ
jgi:hypothetical protein